MTVWQVHGMGHGLAPADWPPFRHAEVEAVLASYPVTAGRDPTIRWLSRRPFSAAALVDLSDAATGRTDHRFGVLVKRHHRTVRTAADLVVEHHFADHLRAGGLEVPEVLRTRAGAGGFERGEWTYEVQVEGRGEDWYRDAPSWTPFHEPQQASAAGEALARLHRAAAGFDAPVRAPGVLVASAEIASAPDPVVALAGRAASRPALADYLSGRPWAEELSDALGGLADRPVRGIIRPGDDPSGLWTHGDWHGSNLLWRQRGGCPEVTAVLDLGLANRTSAVFDVAVAIERSMVAWLDVVDGRRPTVDLVAMAALIGAYRRVGDLPSDRLTAVLPLVHLDFALTEVEYFSAVVHHRELADLAWYGYLLGHLRWWRSPDGGAFLEALDAIEASPR